MERFDASPVYRVTDHQTAHDSHGHATLDQYSDTDDMSFSDNSSVWSMSTLQSEEAAGSSFSIPILPFLSLDGLAFLFS